MNKTIEDLLSRRSIRKFTDKPIAREDILTILEAGKYAASGMGKQAAIMIVVQDPKMLEKLRELNCTSVGRTYDKDNFFGAKTIIVVLANRDIPTYKYDGALVMGNMMNAAWSLSIGSCWIHRARETFDTIEGQQILKDLGVEGNYEGIGNLILGYPEGDLPIAKPRKDNFVYWL